MLFYLSLIDTEEEKSKFEQLYHLYRYTMLHVAVSILKETQLAEDAVHEAFIRIAKNLHKIVEEIYATHQNPYLVAVDASLGTKAHIGYFTLGSGSLKPGSGVGKELLSVGDAHITGIVNMAGLFDRTLLQTTRLNTVMSLADRIFLGIRYGLHLFQKQNIPCLISSSVLY